MTIAQQIEKMGVKKGKKASFEIARQMPENSMDKQSVMKFTRLNDTHMRKLFNNLKLAGKKDTKPTCH